MNSLRSDPDPKMMSQVLKMLPEFDKVEQQLAKDHWDEVPEALRSKLLAIIESEIDAQDTSN